MKVSSAGWIAAVVGLVLSLIIGDSPISACAIALVSLAIVDVIFKIGSSFPLLELMYLMAALQLMLGPYFAYRLPVSFITYRMYVPEEEYMALAVPAHFLYLLGLMVRPVAFQMVQINTQIVAVVKQYPNIALRIMAVGIASFLIQSFVPASLRFVFYLAFNLVYVGGILYYFSEGLRYRTQVYLSTVVLAFVQGVNSGLFHDFLLWTTLGFALIAANWKINLGSKMTLMMLGFLFLMVLQSAKGGYRSIIAQAPTSTIEKIEVLFVQVSSIVSDFKTMFTPQKLAELNVRLNQGWITSAIMLNVPSRVPYENGKTLLESFANALLPRFFFPDKRNAGGRESFRLYTGLPLNDNTSMGIGLLGEAYINFGLYAGVFLFFWGVVLGSIARVLQQLSNRNVLIFFMIPLIFLQVIKVETDMITVLNHLVKSLLFVAIIYSIWLAGYKVIQARSI